jgi:hypothetical protein
MNFTKLLKDCIKKALDNHDEYNHQRYSKMLERRIAGKNLTQAERQDILSYLN